MGKIKLFFLRFLEVALALHGFLHIFEFGIAIYEEAYITATFAAFGAIIMVLGAIFLENEHNHHNINHHNTKTEHQH